MFFKFIVKEIIAVFFVVLIFGASTRSVIAQTGPTSPSTLYIPLIGITLVPDPLALPNGEGTVTYNYAVKNFLPEVALSNIKVVDDNCSPLKLIDGDDNHNSLLEYSETWRYICTTKVTRTTESIAMATGTANSITATHDAYAMVIVGSNTPPPLVSVVNVTKIAYPLSLPAEGGNIVFTYKVNNPGLVPLSNVKVTDNKCRDLTDRLGDLNGNNLLDINEVWIYTCRTTLRQTTTNTVSVTAFANGLQATSKDTITVKVETPIAEISSNPKFPNTGGNKNVGVNSYMKIVVWTILSIVLVALSIFFIVSRRNTLVPFIKAQDSQKRGKK